jgi:hypothetical protein
MLFEQRQSTSVFPQYPVIGLFTTINPAERLGLSVKDRQKVNKQDVDKKRGKPAYDLTSVVLIIFYFGLL